MSATIASLAPDDLPDLRRLLLQPSLVSEFDILQGQGLDTVLADAFCRPGLRLLAREAGTPAGFALGFLLPGPAATWSMLRIGVSEGYRGRGVGSALLEALEARVLGEDPSCGEICMSAWEPCPGAEAFALRHGFAPVRTFWLMERPPGTWPGPDWPDGVRIEVFDGRDAMLVDCNDVYNESFADHYHFVPTGPEVGRAIAAAPGFDPTGLRLAYDGTRCVGFCRNHVHASRGEIAALGVAPAWRGRGLGRALLRWGAAWLADRGCARVTLMVDGENGSALRLYRAEGFEVARTRRIWARPPAAPPAT